MVTVSYHPHFERTIRKISDTRLKEHVKQQILKDNRESIDRKTDAVLPEADPRGLHPTIPFIVLV